MKQEIIVLIGNRERIIRNGLVITDEEKIICQGFASADAEETKVDERTNNLLVIAYGTPNESSERLNQSWNYMADLIKGLYKSEEIIISKPKLLYLK